MQDSAKPSAKYYELCGTSYLTLCPERSAHMNLGMWPNSTLKLAQEKLIREFLTYCLNKGLEQPSKILDLGSGWGGSRSIFQEFFPGAEYFGINSSSEQIRFARDLNVSIPHTHYIQADVEDLKTIDVPRPDVIFSIEAAFHFEDKRKLIETVHEMGITRFGVADICAQGKAAVLNTQYLSPIFDEAWAIENYVEILKNVGFKKILSENVSAHVFSGWRNFLDGLDDEKYDGRSRLLRQFRLGARSMVQLWLANKLAYHFVYAEY